MKFELKNAYKFGWDGISWSAFNNKNDFPEASAAYFEVTGSHGKTKTTKSDRVYFVVEGEGEFEIDNAVTQVSKTDVIIIPKNTTYDYKATNGTLKLFLVHTPAFDPESETQLF